MARDLKNKIKNAYKNETPDLRERILSACENETQEPARSSVPTPVPSATARLPKQSFFFRRIVATIVCLAVFGVGLFVGRIMPVRQPTAKAETCVYLDVNPSLELSLDEDNTVLSCEAANDDAEVILHGMKLEGVELKTALNAIVGAMYVKGYLTSDDNSMLISVDTSDETHTSGFLSYITNQVNEVFADSEMECAIIAQGVKADEALRRRAEEQGISVGKMHLLDKMVGNMEDFTEKDIAQLSGMSIKDLSLIYSQKPNDGQNTPDELISGTVGGYIGAEDALTAVLTEMDKTAQDVEEYRIHTVPSKHGDMKVVYTVTVKLYNDDRIYNYEVDCKTGEVTLALNEPSPDGPPQSGNGFENNGMPNGGEQNQNGYPPLTDPSVGTGENRP